MLLSPSFVDRCDEKDFNRCPFPMRYTAKHTKPSPSRVVTVPDRDGSISKSINPPKASSAPRIPANGRREVIAIDVNPRRGE